MYGFFSHRSKASFLGLRSGLWLCLWKADLVFLKPFCSSCCSVFSHCPVRSPMFQTFSWRTGVLILTIVFSVPTSWNQFFMLDVYNTDGTPLTTDQLCVQLERICDSSQQAVEEPVGILTSQHRDSWGKVYTKLISGEVTRCFSANYA